MPGTIGMYEASELASSSWHEEATTSHRQRVAVLSSEWYGIVDSSTRIHWSSKHPCVMHQPTSSAHHSPGVPLSRIR